MTNNEIQDLINQEKFDEIDLNALDKLFQWDMLYKQSLTLTYDFWEWIFTKSVCEIFWDCGSVLTAFIEFHPDMKLLKHVINMLISSDNEYYINTKILFSINSLPDEALDYILYLHNTTNIINLQSLPMNINQSQVRALSPESISVIKNWYENFKKLDDDVMRFLVNLDISIFKEYITKEEMMHYAEQSFQTRGKRKIKVKYFVQLFSVTEMLDWYEFMIKNIDKILNTAYFVTSFRDYFNISSLSFTQNDIDRIIVLLNGDVYSHRMKTKFSQFSKEDFIKLEHVDSYLIITCKDASLSDYANISSTQEQMKNSQSIINAGRYTEEEMIKYPYMFNIDAVHNGSGLYMSKQTLKILNKAQGTRKRSKEYTTDFTDIIHDNNKYFSDVFTYEYFNYLVQKTNTTNEGIVRALKWDAISDILLNMEQTKPLYKLLGGK